MNNAIIIDDEPHCQDTLRMLLAEYCPHVNIVAECRSAMQGLGLIEKMQPDMIFLDIEMPGMNGFEMLEKLQQISFAVIFTTSYDQYAIKAMHISALDYLLKPVDPHELKIAVKKVQEQRHLPMAAQFQLLLKKIKGEAFNKVAIPTSEGFELVVADEILYCEADDNYVHLYLKSNRKITACRTLKEMEKQLEDFNFFTRVHHSYVVNLNEVNKYIRGDGGYLVMTNGATVNVSKSRKEYLMKKIFSNTD